VKSALNEKQKFIWYINLGKGILQGKTEVLRLQISCIWQNQKVGRAQLGHSNVHMLTNLKNVCNAHQIVLAQKEKIMIKSMVK